jgi:hypothetical protein
MESAPLGGGGPGPHEVRRLPLVWNGNDASPSGPFWEEEGGAGVAERSRIAVFRLAPGERHILRVVVGSAGPAPARGGLRDSPFPPPSWPATLVEVDSWTQGSWEGRFGTLGYAFFNFPNGTGNLVSLPPFIASVVTVDATLDVWTQPDPANDPRALQNPADPAGARAIGCAYRSWTTAADVFLQADQEGKVLYQFAVYVVDFDANTPSHEGFPPRRETLAVYDRATLLPVAPTVYLPDFTGGMWVVFQYDRSVRVRVSQLPGDNAVVSALAFDPVN